MGNARIAGLSWLIVLFACGGDDAGKGPSTTPSDAGDAAVAQLDAAHPDTGVAAHPDAASPAPDAEQTRPDAADDDAQLPIGNDDGGADDDAASADDAAAETDDGSVPVAPGDGGFAEPSFASEPAEYLCGHVSLGPETLLDPGLASRRSLIAGTRAVTQSFSGAGASQLSTWILWDVESGHELTRGSDPFTPGVSVADDARMDVELKGATLLVPTGADAYEVRKASDGSLLNTLSQTSALHLSEDGTYVWSSGSAQHLDGTPFVTTDGDVIYAGASELIAEKDDHLVRTTLPAGTATPGSAFMGAFAGVFGDGQHVFTRDGTIVRIYELDATLAQMFVVGADEVISGSGNYYVRYDTKAFSLSLYVLGNSKPSATFLPVNASAPVTYTLSASTLAIAHDGLLEVIDLSGSTLTRRSFPLSVDRLPGTPGPALVFSADADGHWIAGSYAADGRSLTSAPHPIGCGKVTGIASATSGLVAVTVSSQQLFLFQLDNDGATLVGRRRFAHPVTRLSTDGVVLEYLPVGSSAPTGYGVVTVSDLKPLAIGETRLVPDEGAGVNVVSLRLSQSGPNVAKRLCKYGAEPLPTTTRAWPTTNPTTVSWAAKTCRHEVLDFSGHTISFGALLNVPNGGTAANDTARLVSSPNGHLLDVDGSIFSDGVLSGASGDAIGWLDDTHVLASDGVHDASGGKTRPVMLSGFDSLDDLKIVSDSEVYDRKHNTLTSSVTNVQAWQGAPVASGIADTTMRRVIYLDGDGAERVLLDAFPE